AARAAERLRGCARIFLVGTGTSYHGALAGQFMFRSAGIDAWAVRAFEFADYPPAFREDDGLVLLSHRGSKRFSRRSLDLFEPHGKRWVAITGEGSAIDGGGPARATAYEGALKLREASHLVSAEGHDVEGILHGPLVSIQPGQTVVVIAQPGPALERTQEVIQALGEIGAVVIQVGSAADGYRTTRVDEVLAPIVNVVPLQL